MKIAILAIQGDYAAHAAMLDRLGVEHVYVRRPEDLAGADAIILPGGESSTHLKVMTEEGLFGALKQFRIEWWRIFWHLRGRDFARQGSARSRAGITRLA